MHDWTIWLNFLGFIFLLLRNIYDIKRKMWNNPNTKLLFWLTIVTFILLVGRIITYYGHNGTLL